MQTVLPSAWVEKLFARLQGFYGREFTGQFSTGLVNGVDAGLENAKEVWAEELGGFADHPEAIAYALRNLPDRSPNVAVFRQLCRQAPRNGSLQLEHKETPEEREKNKQRLADLKAALGGKFQ